MKKLMYRIALSLFVISGLFLTMPQTAFATELSDADFSDNNTMVGVAETETFSLQRAEMTKEQKVMYDKMLSNEGFELQVGESLLIGSDAEGDIYYFGN